MNNPSENEFEVPKDFFIIPREIVKSEAFEPMAGNVPENSPVYIALKTIFDFNDALRNDMQKKFYMRN
jgi:hypothetical protein